MKCMSWLAEILHREIKPIYEIYKFDIHKFIKQFETVRVKSKQLKTEKLNGNNDKNFEIINFL